MLRIIALLGPRNGHTGLFPGDPAHSQLAASLSGSPVPVRRRGVRRRRAGQGARPQPPGRDRRHSRGARPRARRAADAAATTRGTSKGLAPHFLLTAEVLDGLGVVEGTGPATFTFERPGGERVDVELSAIPGPQYASAFSDPLHGHYPSVLPRGVTSALPGRSCEVVVGAEARRGPRRLRRLQLRRLAVGRLRARARAARPRPERPPRHRRRPSQRRRRQHDVRRVDVALRLARGRQARQALRADRSGDVLGRGELRRRARPRHAGDVRGRAHRRRGRDATETRPRCCSRRSAGPSTSRRGTTSGSAVRGTDVSPSARTCASSSRPRSTSPAATRCSSVLSGASS